MQVALQRVLIEGAAQPRAAAAELRGNLTQRVEPLELVAVQVLLDMKPEGQLWPCREGETTQFEINKGVEYTNSASAGSAEDKHNKNRLGRI